MMKKDVIQMGFTPGGNYVKKVAEYCDKHHLRKDQVKVVHLQGCKFYGLEACNCEPQIMPLSPRMPRIHPRIVYKN